MRKVSTNLEGSVPMLPENVFLVALPRGNVDPDLETRAIHGLKQRACEYLTSRMPKNVPAAVELRSGLRKFDDYNEHSIEVLLKEYPRYMGGAPFGPIQALPDLKPAELVSATEELIRSIRENHNTQKGLTVRKGLSEQLRVQATAQLALLEDAREKLIAALSLAEMAGSSAAAMEDDKIFGEILE